MKHHGKPKRLPIKRRLPEAIQQVISISLPNPSSKSIGIATIAGASIAGILALTFVVFLILCLLQRRNFQCLQVEQQANRHHRSNDTTYDDLVVTSQRQDESHVYTTLTYNKHVSCDGHINDGLKRN